MKLEGQVAIVTGAGRNIGEAIAKLLAAEGARIAIFDSDRARGEKVAAEIRATGREAFALAADVSKGERGRGRGRGSGAPFRPHRHPRQQRRDLGQQDHPRHHRGGMGPRHGGHAQEPVPHGKARGGAHGGAGSGRAHRQYRLDLGPSRARPRHGIFRGEGRRRQPHSRHGGPARASRHPRQFDLAQQDRLARGQGRVRSEPAHHQPGEAPRPAGRDGARRAVPRLGRFAPSCSARTFSSMAA